MVGIVTSSNNAKFCQSAPDQLLSVNNLPMLNYPKLSVLNYYCQTMCHYWSLAVTAPALKTAHSKKVVAGRRLKLSCKVRVSRCWKVKVFTLFESESFHFAGKWKFSHWLKVKGFCIDGKWKFLHCLKLKVFALLKSESSWYCWKVNVLKLWILTTFEKKKDFFTIMEMKSFTLAGYEQGIPLACNLVVQGWRTPLLSRSPRHHHIKEVRVCFTLFHLIIYLVAQTSGFSHTSY